ncbi:MAG: hypothetical protein P8R42_18005 [Candidatus Binatia bacterium]|nr:hypothetical protein [Candidatus Binatia bacterium]
MEDLADWSYDSRYVELDGLRQAYVDEGSADGPVVGLRVAGLNPSQFARIAIGNGRMRVIDEPLYPVVEDPNVSVDIPPRFEDAPAQQFPLYDGCRRFFPRDDSAFADWMVYAMKANSFRPSEVLEAGTWFDLPAEVEAFECPFLTIWAGNDAGGLGGWVRDPRRVDLQRRGAPALRSLGLCPRRRRRAAEHRGRVHV